MNECYTLLDGKIGLKVLDIKERPVSEIHLRIFPSKFFRRIEHVATSTFIGIKKKGTKLS
jgi:hypothetical protein